ncbi:MAG: ComEC/Rec2 family competence protein [candidate division Zixibacteria bacterium]|nr:ComEC/Rec2 family competence protein [candidate division Zixibacteria bacterium]
MKRRPALLALLAYTSGILLGDYFNLSTLFLLFLILSLLFLLFFFRQEKKIVTTIITLLLILAGFWRYELKTRDLPINHISFFTKLYGKVELKGIISRDPDIREDKTFLEIDTRELSFNHKKIKTTGKILLKIKKPTSLFNYGDLIQLKGYLYSPYPPKNPGAFDYRKYLSTREIFGCLNLQSDSEVKILERGEGNIFISKIILPVKYYILNFFKSSLTGSHQAILSGFVLGERRDIPQEVYKLFTDTGTLHLLAISGSNVAIVVLVFFGAFKLLRIPYRVSLLLVFPLIIVFSFVTGNQPSVVRASIMTSIFLISLLVERERDLINIWALAALVILFANPSSLFDVGFQLSFAATLGLILWVPKLEKLFLSKLKNRFFKYYIALPFFVSLSAQLFTYPVTAYYFNKFSFYSLLANLFIVPLTGLVVMIGASSLLVGLLSLKLAVLFTSFNWLCLELILRILSFFSSLPYADLKVSSPSYLFILAFYLSLFVVIFQKNLKGFLLRMSYLGLIWIGFLLIFNSLNSRSSELRITYLSASGEAVLIEAPQTKRVLINLAEEPQEVERIILPFLYKKGINQLDGLILTDEKRLEEKLSELSGEIKVKEIWVVEDGVTILKKLYGAKVEIRDLKELNQFWSRVKVFSIYPDKKSGRGTFEHSLPLMLSYGKFKLLLAEGSFPESLAIKLKPDIISFNPQGEDLSWIYRFVLNEKFAFSSIISGYKALDYFKVEQKKIFETSRRGAVVIEVDRAKYQIRAVLRKEKLVGKL